MSQAVHRAIIFAAQKHAGQVRKSTDIPYITHPVEVMHILTAAGCSERVIIAGLLHDVLEDTATTAQEIRDLFGPDILDIVQSESEDKSRTWKERKQAAIDRLSSDTIEAKLVCCADKLSNLRSIYADKQEIGENLWGRFNATKNDIRWYYQSIAEKLKSSLCEDPMYKELTNLIERVFE
jgi:(p)ppGpp synthase/HD superfamily hydrolase